MANVIFYVPHQDDDVLTFGADILVHLGTGTHNVKTVLVTDGSKSGVRTKLNGGNACTWHNVTHNPASELYGSRYVDNQIENGLPLTEEDFSNARYAEYLLSMKELGVNEIYIGELESQDYPYDNNGVLWSPQKAPYVDGTLTVAQARSIILKFEAKYPNASHKAQTWLDPHPDHAALGEALRQLYNEGKVSDARFYVKPSFWEDFKTSGVSTFSTPALTTAQQTKYIKALDVYGFWQPGNSRYAIGQHSVPNSFALARANKKSVIHRP